ncbi:hypothetical protein Fmac_000333 [Flemingia macrophylla]|uniref:DUF620 domain-containing protein n=1 Tax=Flemingia macrophylla TaxID=520843 RepID=A0ABD1NDZ9_9FABA
MRKLCPNFDKEDGLEIILEVPIPEEMLTGMGTTCFNRWQNLRSLMNTQFADKSYAPSNNEFVVLVKLVAAPLIPLQGDECDDSVESRGKPEVGSFVLWQKNPDLWCVELVVSGFKVSAGSDGKVAWNQSSSQPFHANKGPARPLRRFFQGLDPRCTANLFLDAECVGESSINNEVCFMLKLQTEQHVLQAQSTSNTEIVMHTMLGYFSQRTGLLVKFEDTKLVKMKAVKGKETVFWETTIESMIEDYRYVDGIIIAHSGRTVATLYRYGAAQNHKRLIEEIWSIEEVDFNVVGLSMDCFMPPSDSEREQDGAEQTVGMG